MSEDPYADTVEILRNMTARAGEFAGHMSRVEENVALLAVGELAVGISEQAAFAAIEEARAEWVHEALCRRASDDAARSQQESGGRGFCGVCNRATPEDPTGWEPLSASGEPIPVEEAVRELASRLGGDALRRVLASDDSVVSLIEEAKRQGVKPFPTAVAWLCPECLKVGES